MEAIGGLVPDLWSDKHRGQGMQCFEKTRCFYIAMCLHILSCYLRLTRILVKRRLESRQRQLGKTAVVKGGLTLCLNTYTDRKLVTSRFWKRVPKCP